MVFGEGELLPMALLITRSRCATVNEKLGRKMIFSKTNLSVVTIFALGLSVAADEFIILISLFGLSAALRSETFCIPCFRSNLISSGSSAPDSKRIGVENSDVRDRVKLPMPAR